MLKGYTTIAELAEALKCSKVWLWKLANAGRIKGAEKVGNTWLIPLSYRHIRRPKGRPRKG